METPPNDILNITERDVEVKLRDFSELLKNIDSLDDKKRALWKEIYTNAISDRHNSFIMFSRLFGIVNNSSSQTTEWAVHGKMLASCIERMQKANEQLVKLADLVARAEHREQGIDPEDLFNKIREH